MPFALLPRRDLRAMKITVEEAPVHLPTIQAGMETRPDGTRRHRSALTGHGRPNPPSNHRYNRFPVVTRLAFIPALAPGLNGSGGLMRMHHRAYSQIRDKWRTLILEATKPKDRANHAPCKVTITRHTTHLMDVDNAFAASKVVLDALRHAGLLADDDPGCVVSLSVPQVKVSKRAEVGTVIELIRA